MPDISPFPLRRICERDLLEICNYKSYELLLLPGIDLLLDPFPCACDI